MSEKKKNSYLTISKSAEGYYKEKGSKFLAYAEPVGSEEDIKSFLEELRKKHYDARHHCYAYILDPDKGRYRVNDDGEPGHSAGDPILGQIRSRELTNTLVVVVRYFGGTKLGVSGLIHAYKTAASEALDSTGRKIVEITHCIKILFPYELTSEIMSLSRDLTIRRQEFTDSCLIEVEATPGKIQDLLANLGILKDKKKPVEFELLKG